MVEMWCLLKFGIVKGHENYYCYSHNCECSKSEVPINPIVTACGKVDVGVEEANAARNKKYKCQNQEKDEHI